MKVARAYGFTARDRCGNRRRAALRRRSTLMDRQSSH
jgi:hypothetical protein